MYQPGRHALTVLRLVRRTLVDTFRARPRRTSPSSSRSTGVMPTRSMWRSRRTQPPGTPLS
jgi:hypothetical protein